MMAPTRGPEGPAGKPERPGPDSARTPRRRILSDELFAGSNEIIIVHQEADYRLRVTSKGKLILTR